MIHENKNRLICLRIRLFLPLIINLICKMNVYKIIYKVRFKTLDNNT